jgi:hypothetical protein
MSDTATSSSQGSAAALFHEFAASGFVVLRGALDGPALRSFQRSIADDLAVGRHNEAPLGPLDLTTPMTWPRAGHIAAHRIVEVVPAPPVPSSPSVHWDALSDRESILGRALDALLGAGAWEVPRNGDSPVGARHWYVPVTFPEVPPSLPLPGACADAPALQVTRAGSHTAALAPIQHFSAQKAAALDPALRSLADVLSGDAPCDAATAAVTWQPINRRRVVGKGWHVDSFHAHSVVLLVLMSDWTPGGGGTAVIPGTHAWVYRQWQRMRASSASAAGGGASAAAPCLDEPDLSDPAAQQALNAWVTSRMRALTAGGQVELLHAGEPGADLDTWGTLPAARGWPQDGPLPSDAPAAAVQVRGGFWSCALLYQLLRHGSRLACSSMALLLMLATPSVPCLRADRRASRRRRPDAPPPRAHGHDESGPQPAHPSQWARPAACRAAWQHGSWKWSARADGCCGRVSTSLCQWRG